jgi:hypothetical protein
VLEARPGSLWTEAYGPNERVPMPMAHGEGRFTARAPGTLQKLAAEGQVPFAYVARSGDGPSRGWPDNPNGAEADAAGVTNARGNVLALMPHPERADRLYHVPEDLEGPWGERVRARLRRGTCSPRVGEGAPSWRGTSACRRAWPWRRGERLDPALGRAPGDGPGGVDRRGRAAAPARP